MRSKKKQAGKLSKDEEQELDEWDEKEEEECDVWTRMSTKRALTISAVN